MQIMLDIQNQHYIDGLEDMAAAVGLSVAEICSGLIELQVNSFIHQVNEYKREAVGYRLTARMNRILQDKWTPVDPMDNEEENV